MAIDLLWKFAREYNRVEKCFFKVPVRIDCQHRMLIPVKGKRNLIWFALSIFMAWGVNLGPQMIKLAFIFFRFRGAKDDEISTSLDLMVIFAYYASSGWKPFYGLLMLIFGQDIIQAFNAQTVQGAVLRKRIHPKKVKDVPSFPKQLLESLICIIPYMMFPIGLILPFFTLYRELDSGFLIQQGFDFFGEEFEWAGTLQEFLGMRAQTRSNWMNLLFLFLRFAIHSFEIMDMCRAYLAIAFLMLTSLLMLNQSVNYIHQIYTHRSVADFSGNKNWFLTAYNTTTLIIQIPRRPLSLTILAILAGFGLVLIYCNYMTLKSYSLLPWYVYFYAPSLSLILCGLLYVSMPRAILCNDQSERILSLWQYEFSMVRDRGYLRRRVKALRPFRLYAGVIDFNFFYMCLSTKVVYYSELISFTITASLSL